MTALEIKYELAKKNLTQSDIARRCKVTMNAVYLVVQGKSRSARIERAIARAIGVRVKNLLDRKAA